MKFLLLLLALRGLSAAIGFINQMQLSVLLGGIVRLLDDLAGVIQWVAYVAALLFIGYSIRSKWDKEAHPES
jgi:hypothetical protein